MAPSAMPGTPSSLATLSTPAVPWALAWVELRVVVVGGCGSGEMGWDGMGWWGGEMGWDGMGWCGEMRWEVVVEGEAEDGIP